MNTSGFYHRDLHVGNLAVNGDRIILLDFDHVVSETDKLTRSEIRSVNDHGWYNDITSIYYIVVSEIDLIKILADTQTVMNYDDIMDKMLTYPEFHELRARIMRTLSFPHVQYDVVKPLMFVFHPDLYQKSLGIEYSRTFEPVVYVNPDMMIQFHYACFTLNVDLVRNIIKKGYILPEFYRNSRK
jgi:hypothetical protein